MTKFRKRKSRTIAEHEAKEINANGYDLMAFYRMNSCLFSSKITVQHKEQRQRPHFDVVKAATAATAAQFYHQLIGTGGN